MTVERPNDLSSVQHWQEVWAGNIRYRLPSSLIVSTRNLQRVLRAHVRPADRFLEIGCAPGKMLAWVSAALRADVSGLDYSEKGLSTARGLFEALGLSADLRCEDLRTTTFVPGSFDIVYSAGVIEHFEDPREVVQQHLDLVKPGGTLLLTIPNYGGLYGALQQYFDRDLLSIHNLEIMAADTLSNLLPRDQCSHIRAYTSGRLSPWVLTLDSRWPRIMALGVSHFLNAIALIQPVEIPFLCPMLVLEARKADQQSTRHRT